MTARISRRHLLARTAAAAWPRCRCRRSRKPKPDGWRWWAAGLRAPPARDSSNASIRA